MRRLKFIVTFIVTFAVLSVFAQEKITPASFKYANLSLNVPKVELSAVSNQALLEEDDAQDRVGEPLRIGIMRDVYYYMNSCGKMDFLPDGGKLWRLQIESPGARSTCVRISNVNIPDEAVFYVYNEDRNVVVEKITKEDLSEEMDFVTSGAPGSSMILEYYEPMDVNFPGNFEIAQVGHIYRTDVFGKGSHGDAEGDCHFDVSCPEGDGWQDQVKSVVLVKIITSTAMYSCSGATINNTRQDGTPYVLTADHCAKSNATYKFYFQYQTSECGASNGFFGYPVSGAQVMAAGAYSNSSDFMLLKITGNLSLDVQENMYLAGWDMSGAATVGSCIHHPGGDYKKISIPQVVSSDSKFWRTVWYPISNNKGVTEQGSSGSPLFDANKRIIGQLYGGNSFCETPQDADYYGKISYSWTNSNTSNNSRKLQPWLDPDNSKVTAIDGIYYLVATGINNQPAAKNSFKVYPNPSHGSVNIALENLSGELQCNVYNMVGKLIHTSKFAAQDNVSLDLSFLSNGVYIMELHNGKSVQTSKIVISK